MTEQLYESNTMVLLVHHDCVNDIKDVFSNIICVV